MFVKKGMSSNKIYQYLVSMHMVTELVFAFPISSCGQGFSPGKEPGY